MGNIGSNDRIYIKKHSVPMSLFRYPVGIPAVACHKYLQILCFLLDPNVHQFVKISPRVS